MFLRLLQTYISVFTPTNVPPVKKIPFYRKQFPPSFNEKGKLQSSALYLLKFFLPWIYKIPSKKYRQSINYTINYAISYAAHWLIINICFRNVIGRKDLINIHMYKYQSYNTSVVIFVLILSFHSVIISFTL